MGPLKRKLQHTLTKTKHFLKNGKISSCRLDERITDMRLQNPPCFQKALFNFTIDFELIWGNGKVNEQEHSFAQKLKLANAQAKCFEPFVEMLEELKFPITWAILAKLVNPNMKPNENNSFNPSWCDDWYDDLTVKSERELWDGSHYIERLQRSNVTHEFLSHGYAHIDFADEATTKEIAQWDIETSLSLFSSSGIPIDGFVYPCNRHNYKELLSEKGIQIIRGEDQSWSVDNELKETPLGFWISPSAYSLNDMIEVIDIAVENRSFVHPWMHLVECDLSQKDIEYFYRPLFEYILKLQNEGRIEVISFKDINNRLRK